MGASVSPFLSGLSNVNRKKYNHITIYKKKGMYSAFPVLYQLEGGTLYCEFRSRPSGSHMDPRGEVIRMISTDGGHLWNRTNQVFYNPGYKSQSGKLTDANAYGWRYVAPSERDSLESNGIEVRNSPDGKVAYAYGCYKRVSIDAGKEWVLTEVKVPQKGLIMTYLDPCTFLRLNQNVLLRAVYGKPLANDNFYESWVMRSEDNGENWDFITIASDPDKMIGMGETALLKSGDEEVLAMVRIQPTEEWSKMNRKRNLYSVRSLDGGKTWSKPVDTGIEGYPASLIQLRNGHVLCTYGYRNADPMGIRAAFSYDNGKTWDTDTIRILRDDGEGQGGDLGYPISVQREDGKIFTLYYMTTKEGITHIAGTIWEE